MIKHIYFSYAESEGEAYSYLKYFFRSIGTWTQDEGQQLQDAIQIHILNEKCLEQIGTERPGCYYLVRKTDRTQAYFNNNRNDLLELKWENRKLKCHDLCTRLVPKPEETEILLDLLDIFDTSDAWGAYWIFHEISNGKNEVCNRYIIDTCYKIKESVSSSHLYKNSWHHKFATIYCDYIICKTKNDVPERRVEKCAALLEKSVELSKEGKAWNVALCWLTARICESSPTERKFNILYYQKMLDRMGCYSSEIYYGLAYAYERIYGDTKTALQYYQKICKNDEDYYRAEYKLALECESRARWLTAILHYQHIYNITTSEKSRYISTRSIEYCSKALGAIINLFSIKDVSQKVIEMFRHEWKKLQEENIVENRFSRITDLMFADSSRELLKNELEKDLHKKINSICVI